MRLFGKSKVMKAYVQNGQYHTKKKLEIFKKKNYLKAVGVFKFQCELMIMTDKKYTERGWRH